MTSLESIVKLRELRDEAASKMVDNPRWVCARAEEIADEIEREIAEKYIELPVDKDGVPWHIGDMTENRNVVNGIAFDRHGAHFISTLNDIDPSIHTHVKPDKLRERVRKFINDRRGLNLKDPQEKADRILDEFCADIREMAKEGEL